MRYYPDKKRIEDAKYLVKDLTDGDDSIISRKDYKGLSKIEIKRAINSLLSSSNLSDKQKDYLLANLWKINYRVKPPTIEEFLTVEWIGGTANKIWPHTRDILCEFWKEDSMYKNLILGSCTRVGKSLMSTLSNLYIAVHLWAMRNPKEYLGLSAATSIMLALISFSLDKAGQLLLQPFQKIILDSEKFKRVKMEEALEARQEELPDKVIWTTAGRMGSIQLYNDIHLMLSSSPANLLGLNMVCGTVSEISFFLDRGFSSDYIWRIYQDTKNRVRNTVGNNYFGRTIIDSSPNDIESSPIDKYIFEGDADKDPDNYIMTGSLWEYRPELFPEWLKTNETFPVFKGVGGKPAQILDKNEVEQYEKDNIYNVPIDLKRAFIENCTKNVKDICGWPSGGSDILISDIKNIEKMFDLQLKNIYTFITAPAESEPKHLIWNKLFNTFFNDIKGRYYFYRAANATRYLHIDQSESGDMAGISMVHPEIDKEGNIIYVTDFTLSINPNKGKINLEAIYEFLIDLITIGHINIGKVTFDQYQSSDTIQRLKRRGVNTGLLSVDRDTAPYYVYISNLSTGKIKAGKNLLLKNNLRSLQEVDTKSGKKKIDHKKGKVEVELLNEDWDMGMIGYYAKDLSDSHCGAFWNCLHEFKGVPKYQWVDYDEMIDASVEDIAEKFKQIHKDLLLKNIKSKYNLILKN